MNAHATSRRAPWRPLLLVGLLLALVGCALNAPTSEARASAALIEYLEALNQGRFADAVPLYGGTYEGLEGWNPDAPANDRAGLLAAGCAYNGLMCLRVADVSGGEEVAPGMYRFVVRLLNTDGTPFVLGPCCGATEEEMPPMTDFPYTVVRGEDGLYRVMELPPFVP